MLPCRPINPASVIHAPGGCWPGMINASFSSSPFLVLSLSIALLHVWSEASCNIFNVVIKVNERFNVEGE
jgi:hypothetical protein